ncbi:Quorum-quenching protein AidA [Cupriavidus yeoncheonensis]|uniref:Quorum-quenching protein AidA n=1 Tax=Cupriavidus yeoncheonensis TaxID=1462994 RepID=A0A916ISA1_9BURK|nr:alpha/beta hydrolase [Cupriavidus yeoncheonensis]CAG2141549.1 Quorum-quenching protein AidA [Cupriavidus yeoncheonensis]
MVRSDVEFSSGNVRCAAWLYRPEGVAASVPCVVMAHGFSAVREQRLDAFAERFVQAGMAVLLFDYRYFGASGGIPRQLLNIQDQLQDWAAAIAFARNLPDIDPKRIALFGSSLSGGHVLTMAARDPAIAAAVAQVPTCDGLRNLPALGLAHLTRLTLAGLYDAARSLVGMSPFYIAATGRPGTWSAMATPEALSWFESVTPDKSTWVNQVCARIALRYGTYRPIAGVRKIQCPTLYCIGEEDVHLAPAGLAHEAASRTPRAEVKTYPCGHFGLYMGPLWERAVADQTDFLVRHLHPGRDA